MGSRLEDGLFLESLRAGGLSHQHTLYLRKFHQLVSSFEGHNKHVHVHRYILNGVMNMGYDVSDKPRDRDGLSIRSHWQRTGNMSVRRNWEYINGADATAERMGRYSLRVILNLVHDIAEERTTHAIKASPEKDPNKLRTYYIYKTKEELLGIIDESCRRAHIRGDSSHSRIFGGIPLLDIIDDYFECFTPGYKVSSSLGENSAIEVGHWITYFNDELSLIASNLFTELKLNDRIDNGPNIFPASRSAEKIFGKEELSRKLARIRADPAIKERYISEFKHFEESSEHRIIGEDRRLQELFKLFIFYSQAAELFVKGANYKVENAELVASVRRPAVRAADEALDRFIETNPIHMMSVAAYRELPHKKRTRDDGRPLPENDAELVSYFTGLTKEYLRTPQATAFQNRPGLAGMRILDGSIAHLVRIEANLGSARRKFKKDPLDNIIRSIVMQQTAEKWQPKIKIYREISDLTAAEPRLSLDASRMHLSYFPGLFEHMHDIIAEERK